MQCVRTYHVDVHVRIPIRTYNHTRRAAVLQTNAEMCRLGRSSSVISTSLSSADCIVASAWCTHYHTCMYVSPTWHHCGRVKKWPFAIHLISQTVFIFTARVVGVCRSSVCYFFSFHPTMCSMWSLLITHNFPSILETHGERGIPICPTKYKPFGLTGDQQTVLTFPAREHDIHSRILCTCGMHLSGRLKKQNTGAILSKWRELYW